MKSTIGIIASTMIALASALSQPDANDRSFSVLEPDSSGPFLFDQDTDSVAPQQTVLEKPELQFPAEAAPRLLPPASESELLFVDDYPAPAILPVPSTFPGAAAVDVCNTCQFASCCCKSNRKIVAKFELVDPSGCLHTACINVPVCCANETPGVTWKGRLFGRQVATICWQCCDHEVKVVVTRRGKVKVRD